MTLPPAHPGARNITPLTPGRPNSGRQIAALARAMGLRERLPWQAHLYALMTERLPGRRRDGRPRYAYQTFVVSTPRRAGKTSARVPLSVHRCMTQRGARVWLTAQTRQDARDLLVEDATPLLEAVPYVSARARLRLSQGSEGWHFTNRSSWRVFAPGDKSIHGKASDLIDVDEAWIFTPAQGAAITQGAGATQLTTGGQMTFMSTVGPADQSQWFGGKLREARAALAAGHTRGVAIVEYALDPALVDPVRDLLEHGTDSPEWWQGLEILAEHHPAYGHQIEAVTDLAAYARSEGLNPDGIMRALGNVPPEQSAAAVSFPAWLALQAVTWPAPSGTVAIGVDVDLDRAAGTISAAWTVGELVHVDVLEHDVGAEWIPSRVATLPSSWPVFGVPGPASDTLAQLGRDGRTVTTLTAGKYAAATQGILDAVTDRARLAHPGHPALNAAVRVAAVRNTGDGARVWSRAGSAGNISPLVAATAARWGALAAPPNVRPVVDAGAEA